MSAKYRTATELAPELLFDAETILRLADDLVAELAARDDADEQPILVPRLAVRHAHDPSDALADAAPAVARELLDVGDALRRLREEAVWAVAGNVPNAAEQRLDQVLAELRRVESRLTRLADRLDPSAEPPS